ncbi:tetratricopeptide repeat protein [Mucilaginibacter ginsenosidivorans]|uniref:Uncharacterized protein n=1 Tax=Mucilaginibacter ginsenosidivorans TaxID=398053 RepID=A0A5B8UZG5_9SPHI|nr:hypothetical protein [Mucilaginibacter ginsenosidivorans]QEC64607.1 hypothetical protein FRZ54_19210 [Mucilaginibacter ginsenosidivorans]
MIAHKLKDLISRGILLFCLFWACHTYANINAIDFQKVHNPTNLNSSIAFLKENLGLYDHWTQNWTYRIPKAAAIKNLSDLYDGLDQIPQKNIEEYLLLGDIAHYIYNMESEPYYQKALDNYQKAIQLNPNDYRPYWFLANHYALSDQSTLAIKTYQKVFEYSEAKKSPYFWFDYSAACFTSGMRSTGLFALQQSYKLQPSEHILALYDKLSTTVKVPNPDSTIGLKEEWTLIGRQNNKISFLNRIVGIKVTIDSTWGFGPGEFKNGIGYMTFKPNTIISKVNNQGIDYSLLVLAQVPKQGQSLSDFLSIYLAQYTDRKPADITLKYKNSVAFEIRKPDIYQNIGGGHMYAIGVERDEPDYPGMDLENVQRITDKDPGKVRYYNINSQYTRLKGKIYYLILLDSCEYIHDESLAVFKDFLENGLFIE